MTETEIKLEKGSNNLPHENMNGTAQTDNEKKPNGLSNGHAATSEAKPKTICLPAEIGTDRKYKHEIVWFNAIGFLLLHLFSLYGLYLMIFFQAHLLTILFALVVGYASGEGVTVGAHRHFAHKGFKAKFIVKLVLIVLQTVAGQNCLWVWVRDHRQHHKFSDTDADPHNANRGFFFSHVGWLMMKKHPKVFEYGKKIDMSDLEADWLVMFQKRYYKTFYLIFAVGLPVLIPMYFWNDTFTNAFFVVYLARTIIVLNITWLVNSAAHIYGYRPYDKKLKPVESFWVSFLSSGEGWHNYHHAFPWDYRASELGMVFNPSAWYIDVLAKYGLAYDLRSANSNMVLSRRTRSGDGTYSSIKDKNYAEALTTIISNHYSSTEEPEEIDYTTLLEDLRSM